MHGEFARKNTYKIGKIIKEPCLLAAEVDSAN